MWFFSRDPLKDFTYEIGAKVADYEGRSIWSLHEATKKGGCERVSMFVFESTPENEHQLALAKAAFKRIKTLRHPNYILYLDGLETEKSCYIITELITPLSCHVVNELMLQGELAQKYSISWGLHQIAKALSFLCNDCQLSHNNLNLWSIFVDGAGEWKVGGLEYTHPHSPNTYSPTSNTIPTKGLAYLDKYDPPEKTSGRKGEKWSTDMWGLGCLIWEIFNGEFNKNTALKEPEKIPKDLVAMYCQLVGANPKSRPSPATFLESLGGGGGNKDGGIGGGGRGGRGGGGAGGRGGGRGGGRSAGGYMDNDFVKCMQFIEEIQIKDTESKAEFFGSLASMCDSFPTRTCKSKLLPRLLEAFEYGDRSPNILNPLFKLGKLLTTEEFQKSMVSVVIKLFSSPDRSTRVKLLQQMEMFGEHLPPPVVNTQIFPFIVTGFQDTNPVVREQTVKSMLHLASKLNYKNLNDELLRHFARLQSKDDQGGIRTNTTICLGKIACYLHPQVRQKVLSSAFLRSFKDPFPASRQAGVMGLSATHNFFLMTEVSQRILPALCTLTLDPEQVVRDQVFKTIKCFFGKLEKLSEDPSRLEDFEKDVNVGGVGIGEAAGWAGWAVSGVTSFTSKLYKARQTQNKIAVKSGGVQSNTIPDNKPPSPKHATKHVKDEMKMDGDGGGGKGGGKMVEDGLVEEEEEFKDGDGWDDEDWGDLNETETTNQDNSSQNVIANNNEGCNDGWEDDDAEWPELEVGGAKNKSSLSSDDMSFIPVTEHKAASSYDWGGKGGQDDEDPFGEWENNSWGNEKQFKKSSTLNKNPPSKEIPNFSTTTKTIILPQKSTHPSTITSHHKTTTSSTKPLPLKTTKTPLKLTSTKTKAPPEPDFFSDDW